MATDASEADSDLCEKVSLLRWLSSTLQLLLQLSKCVVVVNRITVTMWLVKGYKLDSFHYVVRYELDN